MKEIKRVPVFLKHSVYTVMHEKWNIGLHAFRRSSNRTILRAIVSNASRVLAVVEAFVCLSVTLCDRLYQNGAS